MAFRANNKIGFGGFGEVISTSGPPIPPAGYRYLMVNGKYLITNGKYTLVKI